MSAGFNIKGIRDLEKAITEQYAGAKARKIQKEAVNAGADLVVEKLKENFAAFQGTGYSREEIIRSNAQTKNDVTQLKIGWNGPHERWRLVHLNEFGYTKAGKQYIPKGFGVINKTIHETEGDYFKEIERKLSERI